MWNSVKALQWILWVGLVVWFTGTVVLFAAPEEMWELLPAVLILVGQLLTWTGLFRSRWLEKNHPRSHPSE